MPPFAFRELRHLVQSSGACCPKANSHFHFMEGRANASPLLSFGLWSTKRTGAPGHRELSDTPGELSRKQSGRQLAENSGSSWHPPTKTAIELQIDNKPNPL